MTKPLYTQSPSTAPRLRVIGVLLALLATSACAADGTAPAPGEGESGPGYVGLTLGALSASCSDPSDVGANPLAAIGQLQVRIRERTGTAVADIFDKTFEIGSGAKALTVADIPAGTGREITVLGFDKGGTKTPAWFARRSGVTIEKNDVAQVNVALMRFNGASCSGIPGAGGLLNVVYPAVTPIADGKVLVTGGFAGLEDKADEYVIGQAQDSAYLFDPSTGELSNVTGDEGARMMARGLHSGIWLQGRNQVLLVGGTTKFRWTKKGDAPITWSPSDAPSRGYEVFDLTTLKFLDPGQTNNVAKRVLPALMRLSKDYVVVAGGGTWPAANEPNKDTYGKGDLWDPTAGEFGSFVPTMGALPMVSLRAAHTFAAASPTASGTSRYLLVGGASDLQFPVETFTEASDLGSGVFSGNIVLDGDGTDALGKLHFAGMAALSENKFLVLGGVRYDGTWNAPTTEDAYVLTFEPAKSETEPARLHSVRVNGFGSGLWGHRVTSAGDKVHALITGGFTDLAPNASATATLQVFELSGGNMTVDAVAPTTPFVARAAHGIARMGNDCFYLFGGMAGPDDLKKVPNALAETFCPPYLGK